MNRYTIIAVILLMFVISTCVSVSSSVFAVDQHATSEIVDGSHEQAGNHDNGHKKLNLNPLEFFADTAIWTLVIFLVVVLVLGKFAFRPIADALDAREKGVSDNIASAAQANEEAKNILAQYQQKLVDSKEEVRQILDTARKDALRSADGIVEKAKEAAQLEQQRALKDIEAATSNALQSIAEKSATMATDLAGKMIRKEVSPETHRDLIKGALDEFAKN